MDPDISIIIPSYETAETIGSCLKSLEAQEGSVAHEIIVVDSSPPPGIGESLVPHPQVHLLQKQERCPAGLARNLGVEQAKGQLALFMDADVILAKDGLIRLWMCFEEGHRVIGGALDMPADSWNYLAWAEHCFSFHEYHSTRKAGPAVNAPSTVLACDVALFRESSGFTNRSRCQDVELIDQMKNEGISVHFNPRLIGYRIQKQSWSSLVDKAVRYGESIASLRFSRILLVGGRARIAVLPVMAAGKFARIMVRNLVYHRGRGRLFTLLTAPAVFLLICFWMQGLARGLLKLPEEDLERD